MKITCPKCRTEYIVDINNKAVLCDKCNLEYIVMSVQTFQDIQGTIRVISEYRTLDNYWAGEQAFYCKIYN